MLETIALPRIKMSVERPPVPRAEEIDPPDAVPQLHIAGICFGGHTLQIHSERRDGAWPKDAHRLEVYVAFGRGREPESLTKAEYWRSVIEDTVEVRFSEEADGLTATYYGRWVNERGDRGPWSNPTCRTIAV